MLFQKRSTRQNQLVCISAGTADGVERVEYLQQLEGWVGGTLPPRLTPRPQVFCSKFLGVKEGMQEAVLSSVWR